MHTSKLSLDNSFVAAIFMTMTNLTLKQAPKFYFKVSYGFCAVCIVNKALNMCGFSNIVRIFVKRCSYFCRSLIEEKEVLNLTTGIHTYI